MARVLDALGFQRAFRLPRAYLGPDEAASWERLARLLVKELAYFNEIKPQVPSDLYEGNLATMYPVVDSRLTHLQKRRNLLYRC